MPLFPDQLCFNTASLPGLSLREALATGYALGFRAVELLAFDGYRHRAGELAGFYWERMSPAERRELRRWLQPFDHLALHAAFMDLHPLAPNPAIREVSLRQLEVAVQAAHALGAEVVTTHATPVPLRDYEELRPSLVDLYRWLGDLAEAGKVEIGIETGWPSPTQIVDLVAKVDHSNVGITIDVGHLLWALPGKQRSLPEAPALYNDLLSTHLRSAGGRTVHMHLHDLRLPESRDHARLGTGIINYPRLLSDLSAANYKGLLSFELEETDSIAALASSREVLLTLLST